MSDILDYVHSTQTGGVTATGNTETNVIASGLANVQYQSAVAHVRAWCAVTPGSDATSLVAKLYRGADKGGTQVGASVTVTVASAGKEVIVVEATEELSNSGKVQYALSLTQAGGTANGTIDQAGIEVIIT